MLTTMTEQDWKIVLQVFQASRSRRGDQGQDDRGFLEALHYFVVHNITWRALPAAALGDRGYDSKSNRQAARQRGICPAIPYRSNTKDVPAFFPKFFTRAALASTLGRAIC